MRILAIETSCDETGVCIIEAEGRFGPDFTFKILGNGLLSQTETHAPYGGVFPNLARREHEKNLVPLLTKALGEADLLYQGDTLISGVDEILTRETELLSQLKGFLAKHAKPEIDAIAVTHGPGLEPALWVGVNFARALAAAWQLPIVPVNHMEGHIILSAIMGGQENINDQVSPKDSKLPTGQASIKKFKFPLLSLLISGGHTELVLSKVWMQYELIGQTRDDAVGEAFDKVARLLDLPYPGGPEIDRLAKEHRKRHPSYEVTPHIRLPRPMIDTDDYDFSFSGLKTAVRRQVEEFKTRRVLNDEIKMEIAREFEDAVADVLIAKTMRAIDEFGVEAILIGGGVSANEHIRNQLAQSLRDYGADAKLLIPPPELATDNALMIALAGYFHALKKEFAESDSIRANGNLKLASK